MNSRLRELLRNGCDPRLLDFYAAPQGGKGSTPPPPDYSGAAQAQSTASKEIANMQNWANRPDQYTPWGSTTWQPTAAIDPATGQTVTRWTQEQQLTPQMQQALDQQMQLQNQRSQLAGQFQQRVAEDYSKPFNWTNLPGVAQGPQAQLTGTYDLKQNIPMQNLDLSRQANTTQTTNEPAFGSERRRIEEGLFQRMRPEQQRQEASTRTMLANQGFTPGSEGYNRELQRLQEQQSNERYDALMRGGEEQKRLQDMLMGQQQQAFGQTAAARQAQMQAQGAQFGMGQQAADFYNRASQGMFSQDQAANAQNFQQLQAQADYQNRMRQQAIAEQAMSRGMSLNEMNALLQGQQVGTPQMPAFMSAGGGQAPNLMGAMQGTYQSGLDAYNARQAQSQGLMSGIGSIAGIAAAAGF